VGSAPGVVVNEEIKAVEFEAELRQIKSMADHSYNVTINVPEYCLPQVQKMMEWLAGMVKVVIEVG
jgi:hypothetical protein